MAIIARRWRLLLVVSLCSLTVGVPIAQQPAGGVPQAAPAATEGTAAVSGVVIDATTRQPIAGVMVYLGFQGRGAVGRLSRQISDEKGRFVFTDLPAGNNYFINASKFGYLEGHYGVGAGGLLGGLITVTDGQWFRDATIVMQRPVSITGTIVDEQGAPAVGVFVRVLSRIRVAGREQLAAGLVTKTDDRGVYRLAGLAPGRYIVQVPFVQQGISAALTPAELAGVTPEQLAAGRTAPEAPPAIDLDAATRLVVGNYLLPPPQDGRARAYQPLFYPSVTSVADAATLDLKPGEQRANIDLALRAVPATSIAGVVTGPPDVLAGLLVRLLPDGLEDLGSGSEVATFTVGGDGRFTIVNVPAGAYTLDARRSVSELVYRTPLSVPTVPLPPTPGSSGSGGSGSIMSGPYGATYTAGSTRGSHAYWARTKIAVGAAPLTDLNVTLQRGATIRGRFVTESGEPPKLLSGTTPVYAEPADGNLGAGMLAGTRPTPLTFEIDGLRPASYTLRFVGLGNAVVSIVGDGVDHRVTPFDGAAGRDFNVVVTLTDKRTDLSGTATDARGGQVKNAVVIAFPVEREQWTNYGLSPARLRSSPTSSSGTYRFQSLPAGDYYVVAVPPDQANAWQDPGNLAKLAPLAARVGLAWGDVKTQSVTVVKLP